MSIQEVDKKVQRGDYDQIRLEKTNETRFQCAHSHRVTAQVLRSFGQWSGGVKKTEHSIQNAYINLIENAEKFIHIDNQYFITNLLSSKKSNTVRMG